MLYLEKLSRSRAILAVLVAVVALAVAGTTLGYAAMNKSVTLSLDGRSEQVSALGGTVGDRHHAAAPNWPLSHLPRRPAGRVR